MKLNQYNLLVIEQPITAGYLINFAKLQKQIKIPICLDESFHSYDDVSQAIELNSCKVINLEIES